MCWNGGSGGGGGGGKEGDVIGTFASWVTLE